MTKVKRKYRKINLYMDVTEGANEQSFYASTTPANKCAGQVRFKIPVAIPEEVFEPQADYELEEIRGIKNDK